jgi:glycosyltransferase involved in cell wall biosynthesis
MISFIVPAYNEETELPSTLAAIRAAASDVAQPFEIIVVDDASTDATPEIAEQAGARVVSIHRRQIAAPQLFDQASSKPIFGQGTFNSVFVLQLFALLRRQISFKKNFARIVYLRRKRNR